MYNIGICDDSQDTCNFIEDMILQYTKEKKILTETQVWYSGEALCSYLHQGNHLDMLFLDIELLRQNGIEVGSFIRNQLEDREMQIIYISAESSYAQRLFKTQPLDFLIKPIMQPQLYEVLELAFKVHKKNTEKFEFQKGKDYYYIFFREISYFVSNGRKIKIVTSNGTEEFYGKLKDIEKRLSKDFIMIHQSILVNKMYIKRYTYESVIMLDGTMLEISKAKRKQVREKILKEE